MHFLQNAFSYMLYVSEAKMNISSLFLKVGGEKCAVKVVALNVPTCRG
jgi:hypothetical protein